MMTGEQLKAWPAAAWQSNGDRPEVHRWLAPSQTTTDKHRLAVVGNVVVPQMAFYACNCLCTMWPF